VKRSFHAFAYIRRDQFAIGLTIEPWRVVIMLPGLDVGIGSRVSYGTDLGGYRLSLTRDAHGKLMGPLFARERRLA